MFFEMNLNWDGTSIVAAHKVMAAPCEGPSALELKRLTPLQRLDGPRVLPLLFDFGRRSFQGYLSDALFSYKLRKPNSSRRGDL